LTNRERRKGKGSASLEGRICHELSHWLSATDSRDIPVPAHGTAGLEIWEFGDQNRKGRIQEEKEQMTNDE
jgi:hypothetical protein